MITKAKKLVSAVNVAIKINYLLNGHTEENNRVLLVEFDENTYISPYQAPIVIADQFAAEMEEYTEEARNGEDMPSVLAQDVFISFSVNDVVSPREAVDRLKEAVSLVMGDSARMGIFVVHGDHEYIHVHGVFSVVDENGKIFSKSPLTPTIQSDWRAWERANEIIENNYGYEKVKTRISEKRYGNEKGLTQSEYHQQQKLDKEGNGQLVTRKHLQRVLKNALDSSNGDFKRFMLNCQKQDISVNIRTNRKGIQGVTYIANGVTFKGSSVGKAFTGGALKKALNFDLKNPNHTALLENASKVFSKTAVVRDLERTIHRAAKARSRMYSPKKTKSAKERLIDRSIQSTTTNDKSILSSPAITSEDPKVRADALAAWFDQLEALEKDKLEQAIGHMESRIEAEKADQKRLLNIALELLGSGTQAAQILKDDMQVLSDWVDHMSKADPYDLSVLMDDESRTTENPKQSCSDQTNAHQAFNGMDYSPDELLPPPEHSFMTRTKISTTDIDNKLSDIQTKLADRKANETDNLLQQSLLEKNNDKALNNMRSMNRTYDDLPELTKKTLGNQAYRYVFNFVLNEGIKVSHLNAKLHKDMSLEDILTDDYQAEEQKLNDLRLFLQKAKVEANRLKELNKDSSENACTSDFSVHLKGAKTDK
ncbi:MULTISPECIES: relaxase/mobilization nuclease domain-containing protein [unclassified Marinobacterium]|uniref:relaxase/mobilization nuclease domain-containing protein n=1 Tax=unclassified Marinobacterium TaxID=2644139 RepID=UPI00156960F9|nr:MULTISPECIES: hypothetical protein [unclassified Marinobacterium]NRP10078.1 hypothetical protein [Marinobacterium sp. xm-g-48]NRP82923.1 hypothetical protein [Marinobacterium sp. xm-d-509]